VGGVDDFSRRDRVQECGSTSAIPLPTWPTRLGAFLSKWGDDHGPFEMFGLHGNRAPELLTATLGRFQPDAVVHLGEMPSAPWSMKSWENARLTMDGNVMGSLNLLFAMREACPDAHLVKLGTMGEYGTPDCPIPEGYFPDDAEMRLPGSGMFSLAGMAFPRKAGSWYHWTKVHDTGNVMFACRTWGLAATDIMQGVVYGTRIDAMGDDPRLATRFDFDECFGTAINRFCAQAVIGHPLTVYGSGKQTRAFLPLRDSMRCLQLAIENPAEKGEHRVFNQFARPWSVQELANATQAAGQHAGLGNVPIQHYDNPRHEAAEHFYQPVCEKLKGLGYEPSDDLPADLDAIIADLLPHRDRIEAHRAAIAPQTQWNPKAVEVLEHEMEDGLSEVAD